MNTYWGKPHDSTLARIEFIGSAGAYHRVPLVANVNIRDFDTIPPSYADSLDSRFAVPVFSNGRGQRLDKQTFRLPQEFLGQRLTEIRISDSGATNVQRVFLYGITAKMTPIACS